MLLRLGDQMIIADRMPGGAPGPGYGVSGWGMPKWASRFNMSPEMKPTPVGARYFCGDDYPQSVAQAVPCAQGNMYDSTRFDYQEHVRAHYTEEHPDLHYPIDQNGLDDMRYAKRKAAAILARNRELKAVAKWKGGVGGGAGGDMSGFYRPVSRPRELPDFTEFDFPDADLADAATEEIELDQLISISAREGRRLLGVEMQNINIETAIEFLTATDNADLSMDIDLQLNTRTGGHNLDDPENLWRTQFNAMVANIEATAGTGSAIFGLFSGANDVPPGGLVYVAPRLFWRLTNNMDRQIDTGDLFTRIATINQPLSTFLLFELLEQFSGLFGLT